VLWIRRFVLFHRARHPRELAEGEVNRFLTRQVVQVNVAASTQNQGLAAVLFFYEHVLEQPLNRLEGLVRARRPKRLPVVSTREEVEAVLAHLWMASPGWSAACSMVLG
jgi:integrase